MPYSEPARRRCSGRCRSIWRNWPELLEGDPTFGGGPVDLLTGQVWPQAAIDYARETGEEDDDKSDDPDRWLWVTCEGSRARYHEMVQFIGTVDDPHRADRLGIAIEGPGAFRRFKDVLARWPGELDRWYGYADDRQRGRARRGLRGLPPSTACRSNRWPSTVRWSR